MSYVRKNVAVTFHKGRLRRNLPLQGFETLRLLRGQPPSTIVAGKYDSNTLSAKAAAYDTIVGAISDELQKMKKYPFGKCTDMKVLGSLTYSDAARMLLGSTSGDKAAQSVGWWAVGRSTNRLVDGNLYTARDCFLEALGIDPKNGYAWNSLGHTITAGEAIMVHGTSRTKRDCYLEALRVDPNNSDAWNNLGCTMAKREVVMVNGSNHTERECYLEVLRVDPRTIAWNNLGSAMSATMGVVMINGINRTERENATSSHYDSILWTAAENATKRDCYLESLRVDPKYAPAWTRLGYVMTPGEAKVMVNGTRRSKRDCHMEAFRLDPGNRRYGIASVGLRHPWPPQY